MYGPFPFLVRCIVGRCRSALFLLLYWWISLLWSYRCLLLVTNNINKYRYKENKSLFVFAWTALYRSLWTSCYKWSEGSFFGIRKHSRQREKSPKDYSIACNRFSWAKYIFYCLTWEWVFYAILVITGRRQSLGYQNNMLVQR
jgi:hypothetical protein